MKTIKLTVALMVLSGWPAPAAAQTIRIDHSSVALFDQIPTQYLDAARNLDVMFRTASVGQNISSGLNCLAYNGANACRTGFSVPATQVPVVSRPQYSRSRWLFEFRGNPGWYGKLTDFIAQLNQRASTLDVAMYKQSYVDDSSISQFWDVNRNPGITQLVNAENANPNVKVVYWTASLAKDSIPHIETWNTQMRAFAGANNKPLFDVADLMHYAPDGTPCPTPICAVYSSDLHGGHYTNGAAQQRAGKAFWVLMARLAGWNPGAPTGDTTPPLLLNTLCTAQSGESDCHADYSDNVGVTSVETTITARDAAGNATTVTRTTTTAP
jgi:hypothetical protein